MIWDLPYQTQSFKGLLKNTDGFPKPKVTSPGTSLHFSTLRKGTHQTESLYGTQCPSPTT